MTLRKSVRVLSIAVASAFIVPTVLCPATIFAAGPAITPATPAPSTPAPAAPAPAAPADAGQPYVGLLNDDNVYVRSGPSDVYYATTKLTKNAKVTVVAVRNDWLKILPPEGSYSYVAKAYIEKRGDGTVGRVTKADLNVRAGSSLNGLKTTVQTSLQQGEDVKIVGEQDDYFKIAPPSGAYLYVKRTFVDAAPQETAVVPPVAPDKVREPLASDPVPAGGVVQPTPGQTTVGGTSDTTTVPNTATASNTATVHNTATASHTVTASNTLTGDGGATATGPTSTPGPVISTTPGAGSSTTQPTVASTSTTQPTVAVAPTSQPTQATAEVRFDTAEAAFLDATSLPLEKQPVDTLLKKYTSLSKDGTLPASMRRIVEARVATLKLRADARTQLAAAMKMAADADAKHKSLVAEQDELQQRAKDQELSIFAAVGTLRISSLQQSSTTMYRLTDPNTGRTLLYIKSNDPKYTQLLNQFVGIKGDIAEDTTLNLKILTPTDAQAVDPAKVNTTITATVIPPSLLVKNPTASISGN